MAQFPSTTSAYGVWTLQDVRDAVRGNNWPVIYVAQPDPNFNRVSLLLNGDGPDGGQNNTYTDSSTNSFTITKNGDVAQGSVSPFGDNWANYLDGPANNTYLRTSGGATFSGDLTAECWVNCDYVDPTAAVIFDFRGGAANNNPSVFVSSSGLLGMYINNTVYNSGINILNDGQWHHVALVRSSGVYTLYVDGVSTTTASIATSFTATRFQIGADDDGSSNAYYGGYISNLRIVNGTALYTSAFTPPTEPLTAISGTELLTCQSNYFVDNSTNGFTLTIVGAPKVTSFSPFANSAPITLAANGGSGYLDGPANNAYLRTSGGATFSGDLTAECWVNCDYIDTPYGGIILDFRGGTANNNPAIYAAVSGELNMYVNGTSYPSGVFILNDGQWHHVALVRSSGVYTLYVDGVSTTTASIATSFTAARFQIGEADVGGVNAFYGGYISNLRIVNGTAVYTSAFTPPTEPLTAISGTALLLNFEDAAIFDYAAVNNVNTVGNADISTAVVKYGTGSLAFDGTGDYLNFPVNTTLSFGVADFTIEGWMNVASIDGTYRCIFSIGPPVQIYARNGTIECYFDSDDSGSPYIVTNLQGPASSITANTWHYFTVVRNGTTFTAYIDGVAGTPATGVTGAVFLSANGAAIGIYGGTTQYPFTGYIDDLRITKGLARYTANFTPPTEALPTF